MQNAADRSNRTQPRHNRRRRSNDTIAIVAPHALRVRGNHPTPTPSVETRFRHGRTAGEGGQRRRRAVVHRSPLPRHTEINDGLAGKNTMPRPSIFVVLSLQRSGRGPRASDRLWSVRSQITPGHFMNTCAGPSRCPCSAPPVSDAVARPASVNVSPESSLC